MNYMYEIHVHPNKHKLAQVPLPLLLRALTGLDWTGLVSCLQSLTEPVPFRSILAPCLFSALITSLH